MKISLSQPQNKFIENIPELESLARTYIAIDRLLTDLKTKPELIDKLIQVQQEIEPLINTLYNEIMLNIIELKPNKVEQLFFLKNPELRSDNFNTLMHCYKIAKMKLPWPVLEKIQRKLFTHIQQLVRIIQRYRRSYHIPKSTQLILESLQKLEQETVSVR